MKVRPVCTIRVRSPDIQRSAEFYAALLGVDFRWSDQDTTIAILRDLVIVLTADGTPSETTSVVFAVDDLDEAEAAVAAAGGVGPMRNRKRCRSVGRSPSLTLMATRGSSYSCPNRRWRSAPSATDRGGPFLIGG